MTVRVFIPPPSPSTAPLCSISFYLTTLLDDGHERGYSPAKATANPLVWLSTLSYPTKFFSENGVSVAAMCAESHQYRPLRATEGGASADTLFTLRNPSCGRLMGDLREDCTLDQEAPQACKCLRGFQLLQWALLDSNQRHPACKMGVSSQLNSG